jgi:hypothetical protein
MSSVRFPDLGRGVGEVPGLLPAHRVHLQVLVPGLLPACRVLYIYRYRYQASCQPIEYCTSTGTGTRPPTSLPSTVHLQVQVQVPGFLSAYRVLYINRYRYQASYQPTEYCTSTGTGTRLPVSLQSISTCTAGTRPTGIEWRYLKEVRRCLTTVKIHHFIIHSSHSGTLLGMTFEMDNSQIFYLFFSHFLTK